MDKSNGNLSCIAACLVVLVALAVVVYGRGCHLSTAPSAPVSTAVPSNPPNADSPAAPNDVILFKVSETYYDLVKSAADAWGQSPGNTRKVQMLKKEGSRDAMQHLLTPTGDEPIPDIWLSSTRKLVDDLGAADKLKKSVNPDDSSLVVAFPPQPLVFLVRKHSPASLGEILRRSNPLPELPKGQFHFSCADILKSGGGDSAATYLKWAYLQTGSHAGSFTQFLQDLKARGFVAKLKDSGPLAADFATDPALDFILVHKTLADRERDGNSGLYEIVPKSTVFEQPAAVILQSGLRRHGDKAKEFLRYLKTHIGLSEANDGAPIEVSGDTQNEKRQWETVFNGGARLDKSKP